MLLAGGGLESEEERDDRADGEASVSVSRHPVLKQAWFPL